jgi:hypothetical protein
MRPKGCIFFNENILGLLFAAQKVIPSNQLMEELMAFGDI